MERECSDEEEEEAVENLIDPNERKMCHSSSFQIGEIRSRIGRNFGLSKRYLLAICLPLFLIFLYFSLDIGGLFHNVSTVTIDTLNDRMRESELHALYLLRNQQLALLHLLNRTSNSTLDSNSTVTRDDFSFFKSTLLNQIKLNKEIQKALLSSHRLGNASQLLDDDSVFGAKTCRKVDQMVGRRTIEWKPKSDRYLFAICLSGQMSNHLICLEKHMFFAALLNRMLVLPSPKLDYQYDRVVDVDQINKCFGRKVVISFQEFSEIKKKHMRIDRFICYVADPPCYLDDDHVKRLESLGLSLGKREIAWPDDAKSDEPKKRVVQDIVPKFSCDDQVLAIGDLFYANVEEEWVMQPSGPLAHKCKTVIQPSRLIALTAQRFVQTFLGKNFIALHFRRHGFLKFCNVKKESCFFPVPQAAECILRVVERANAPVIYLSTDAAESETELLQSLTVLDSKTVPLVKRPAHTSVEKWDALLYRNHIGGDNQVEAMLDKTICAMSTVFIGSSGSTFTEDILRLRKDWGTASICDEYLCQGEQPNFIAETE
ncbi:O-fucosyltransferase 36-like [Tasmannia lanceolata]|uniref:O-fucosyltransferase 36-like n=1 Tax=Tasmannia lanceolata TaxID=3420 RepID=UPI0040629CE3